MKRYFLLLCLLFIITFTMVACGTANNEKQENNEAVEDTQKLDMEQAKQEIEAKVKMDIKKYLAEQYSIPFVQEINYSTFNLTEDGSYDVSGDIRCDHSGKENSTTFVGSGTVSVTEDGDYEVQGSVTVQPIDE